MYWHIDVCVIFRNVNEGRKSKCKKHHDIVEASRKPTANGKETHESLSLPTFLPCTPSSTNMFTVCFSKMRSTWQLES